MIQFKRGSTKIVGGQADAGSWKDVVLQDGQPGYDKTSNRLKIGDGHSKWQDLKWLKSGFEKNQILDSEAKARARLNANKEDITIFTYGTVDPTDSLVGEVYLHQYEGALETDYVIETGVDGQWTYRKWQSGLIECWCSVEHSSIAISNEYGSLFKSAAISPISYPSQIYFREAPVENVTSMTKNSSGVLSDIPIFTCIGANNTKNQTSRIYLCSAQKITTNLVINYSIKGRS